MKMTISSEVRDFLNECREENEVWNFIGLLVVMVVTFVVVPLLVGGN